MSRGLVRNGNSLHEFLQMIDLIFDFHFGLSLCSCVFSLLPLVVLVVTEFGLQSMVLFQKVVLRLSGILDFVFRDIVICVAYILA